MQAMKKFTIFICLCFALALTLSACGGFENTPSPQQSAPPIAAAAPIAATLGRRITPTSSPCIEGQIKGNLNSKIYHVPGQQYYAVTKNNVQCFDTEEQAIAAGFRRSKV